MNSHKKRPSAEEVKAPPPGETEVRDWSTRQKVKEGYAKCARCAGTGEVREAGHYAVRCPVCMGSRLAHQADNRQLDVFVDGPVPKAAVVGAASELPPPVIKPAESTSEKPFKAAPAGFREPAEATPGLVKATMRHRANGRDAGGQGMATMRQEVHELAENMASIGERLKSAVHAYNEAIPGLDRMVRAKSKVRKRLASEKGAETDLPAVIKVRPKPSWAPELIHIWLRSGTEFPSPAGSD